MAEIFCSESKLNILCFKNIINIFRLTFNILIRFYFVQFVVPNKFREWLFLNPLENEFG